MTYSLHWPHRKSTSQRLSKQASILSSTADDQKPHFWQRIQMRSSRKRIHVDDPETVDIQERTKKWDLTAALTKLEHDRDALIDEDKELGFEYSLASRPEEHEETVNAILQNAKIIDNYVYETQPGQIGFNGQQHPRFAGDHFLSNKGLIDNSMVYQIARRLPKGAHLHVHFNSCLKPDVLLNIAKDQEDMWISSDKPLTSDTNLKLARIRFSMKAGLPSTDLEGNLFDQEDGVRTWQNFKEFLDFCDTETPRIRGGAMKWLEQKMIFGVEETHNLQQSTVGAWDLFNARTQMLKGLFNYEVAYREYTRQCLEGFVADNIQYVEIRPNFMEANFVWRADGTRLNNEGIVQMIIEVVEEFQKTEEGKDFLLKIIYCCPRSSSKDIVKLGLDHCFDFKQKWPKWIAGFDLVGEESKGHPLKFFHAEFLEFQHRCDVANLDIPFLFHCGETLDEGTETDGNLLDALLLKSKRIGHGFALAKHPAIMQRMKMENICLELCPISNEVLGLTPRVGGHAMYTLLANDVHCTVNSDNGTLFNSTLSHDFYQVMVGKSDMTLWGWKQLIKWSLEHSVWVEDEQKRVTRIWEEKWKLFLELIETLRDPVDNAVAAIKACAEADTALKKADAAVAMSSNIVARADTADDKNKAAVVLEEAATARQSRVETREKARNDAMELIKTAIKKAVEVEEAQET